MYALPITLRYKGEKKFYTNWGALLTVLIGFTALGIFASGLISVLNNDVSGLTLAISTSPVS
jgi:hypothetical protein